MSIEPGPRADTTPSTRRRRVVVAGHQGDLATVRAALGDESGSVRASAVGALVRLGQCSAADIERLLGDPDPEVRRRVAGAVASTGGHPEGLLVLLGDNDPVVAETAAWAAGELSSVPTAVLDRIVDVATDHPEHLVREAAVAALGAIGAPSGLPAVLRAMGERATIRRRAVLALSAFEGPAVTAALERARSDRDRQVRQAAEDLLG